MKKLFFMCLLLPTLLLAQYQNDTVLVTPQVPTIKDSVHFNLFNFNNCCCSSYHNKSISLVNDSTLYLNYEVDDSNCMLCLCIIAGSWTPFKTAPLKAGTYGIYKVGNNYCAPGKICPLLVVAPKRVGEVTVVTPKPTGITSTSTVPDHSIFISSPVSNSKNLVIATSIINAQARIVDLNGNVRRVFSQIRGSHLSINVSDFQTGVYMVEIKQDDLIIKRPFMVIR